MPHHHAPELLTMDLVGPSIGGLLFILIMSFVPEPARQRFNAIFVAGAGSAYLNGGLGVWEFAYIALATALAFKGLSSYRYIGIAWLSHTIWDVMHHLYATPIWPWMPTSSAGCAVFDAVIALWFFLHAPSAIDWLRSRRTQSTHGNI
jgi:Family of unknown function (DUF6010)